MAYPEISVLLVSWNTRARTRDCLASLPGAVTDGLRYEVIVVDNGSRDGSAEILADRPDLLLLRNERNLGFAAAVNAAYACSRGEMILLLNSDVCFRPGALTVLARFLRERPDAAGVAPLYVARSHSRPDSHYCRLPTLPSAVALMTALRRLPGFRGAMMTAQMHAEDFSRPRPVPQPAASCLLLRRSVLPPEKIFDERLPIYYNDVLLAHQLAFAGHQLWMTPDSVVTHAVGASTSLLGPALRQRHHLGALVRYLRITQPTSRLLTFQALVLVDWVARRLLLRRSDLGPGDLCAALRGDVGPLPDSAWPGEAVRQTTSVGPHVTSSLPSAPTADYAERSA